MSWRFIGSLLLSLMLALCASSAFAQMPNPYGAPISVDNAKKAAAAAVAEARKNNWAMAVAVTDPGGSLVYFEKMDGTQTGSVNVALCKARSAALYKRPDADSIRHPCPLEISSGPLGILGVAVGVNHAPAIAHRARPPDGRIPDRRTHLKDRLGGDHQRQLMQDASHRGSDDGNLLFCSQRFHLRQHLVAWRKRGIHIVFNGSDGDPAHAPMSNVQCVCQTHLSVHC